MKTGQSTTSFHPATGNPIMTSTTYNRYADPVTDESKTGCSNESLGGTLDSNRGRGKTGGKGLLARILLGLNSLLPLWLRPIKSKRAHRRTYLGVGHRLFTYRMLWRSHWKNALLRKLGLK
jgi:hypothetical protein